MQVKILDQTYELANERSAIEELFSVIEEKLKNTGYIFSSLTVDGVEINADYGLYLSQHINEIQEIEVRVKSFRSLMAETMASAVDYLERARPEVENLSDEFYRGPTEESWYKLGQLLEGLQWLLEVLSTVENYQPGKQSTPWGVEFKEKVKLLQEALENSDHVLLGDLLQYEISPFFSTVEEATKKLLKTEGCTDDLN